MKKMLFMIVSALICGVVFTSCINKVTDEHLNFYDVEYRVGLWVNVDPERQDTLKLMNTRSSA